MKLRRVLPLRACPRKHARSLCFLQPTRPRLTHTLIVMPCSLLQPMQPMPCHALTFTLHRYCSTPKTLPYTLVAQKVDASCMRNTVHKPFTKCSSTSSERVRASF